MSLRRLSIFLVGFALLVPLLRAAKGEVFSGLGRKWQYYQSPNFELYSANNERDSRDVLEKMELLRAVFLDTFKLKVRLPQPVTIYYFDRQADFDGYKSPQLRGSKVQFSGFCSNYADRTVITLAPAENTQAAREVVYHEYIHYLFRITELNPAPWFNEGVAELFSTMQEDREWLQLGQPVAGRIYDLRRGKMMPFEQLFAVGYGSPIFQNSGHTGIFYAQSWVFLHYCCYGVNKIPPEKMALFLRAAGSSHVQEQPEQFRAVCQELLGADYPELLRELERYYTSGRFMGRKVPRPVIPAKATYLTRPAPADEMQERLAELSLRVTRSAYANLLIRDTLSRQPDTRLHELLGMVAFEEGETDVAREHWSQAVELGTTNAAIFRELGRIESNLLFSTFNIDYRLPDARAERLRNLLHKSLACAPDQSMGYEMLAWVEATARQPDIAAINLVQQHFKTLNDPPHTLLALILVRFKMGETKAALEMLDQLDKMNLNPWAAYCAEVTRARIENRPVDQTKLPATAPGREGGTIMRMPILEPPR